MITTLIILTLLLSRKFPSLVTLFTISYGLMFCLVSSLRYCAYHYLIYSDIFFVGAIMLLIIQCDQCNYSELFAKNKRKILCFFYLLFCLSVYFMGFKQYQFILRQYVGKDVEVKDRADLVYMLQTYSDDYKELMLSKYKSIDNVTKRVCNDPYLNGLNRGINLREKPAAKKYYSQFFVN